MPVRKVLHEGFCFVFVFVLKQKENLCIKKKPREQLQAQGWKWRDNRLQEVWGLKKAVSSRSAENIDRKIEKLFLANRNAWIA